MDVKIGMNMLLWGIQITPQHIPIFERLAAAGYDGVEIPVVGQSMAEIKAMAAACDDLWSCAHRCSFYRSQTLIQSPPARIHSISCDRQLEKSN